VARNEKLEDEDSVTTRSSRSLIAPADRER
jgi:hypothetical protein